LSVTAPPLRDPAQRLAALSKANRVRVLRGQLKRAMTLDRAIVTVRRPPEFAASMKVYDVLVAVPKLGPVRARRLMCRCGISDAKTLIGMTERQRLALILELTA
jgi:hypothetical protein